MGAVSAVALAAAIWALLAGWLAPGWLAATALRLGSGALERLVVALALGRLLFAALVLLATSTLGAAALPFAAGLAAAALAIHALRRLRRPRPAPAAILLAIGVALASAALLVTAISGRSGVVGNDELVFFGHDSTNDPLVYAAMALRLEATGLPLTNPHAGGAALTSSYVPYAGIAGLHALGVPMLDAVFRVLPFADAASLGLGAVALARALGGAPAALAAAPVLLLLGGDPSPWLAPLGTLAGRDVRPVETWAFFGPYLLAVNPITPALQTLFAALLLLARPGQHRRGAVVAGVLVGSLFEIKLFLWAPAFAALLFVAWLWPPAALARRLRLASAVALAVSLPSWVEKALWARALRGAEATGFGLCPGCFPRYLANAAFGDHDLSFRIFREFSAGDLLDPGVALTSVLATIGVIGVGLGARLLALPSLVRGARGAGDAAAGAVAVHRLALTGALAGLGLAIVGRVAPHPLNVAQFAWIASYGLWLFVALALARWVRERRAVPIALLLALSLPGTLHALLGLGWRSPASIVVPGEAVRLLQDLAAASRPEDVVFEPSMIADPDHPSPVAWLAGRPVYLSLLSAVLGVPEAERERRFDELLAVFVEEDPAAGLAALRSSGTRYLLVPAGARTAFDPREHLEEVARNDAGSVFRVAPGSLQAPEAGTERPGTHF
jgi:hypothetical protein